MYEIILAATVWLINPASAAQAPSFTRCEALAEQRGGDVGGNNHRKFMAECMAGKIPELPAKNPTARQTRQAQGYDKCESLAEQRGSEVGAANHRRFIAECRAGKIR